MKKAAALALLTLLSCTNGDTPRPVATPSGPPTIQPDVIAAHAEQFEEDLPDRTAGSEQEFAAATYITAHLQQAGYVVEFDSVPVANTVRSTNVVALPPSTEDPVFLVVVAYDSSETPASIAAFLEIARALRAAAPAHSVEFAALGADAEELGTRRMIKLLQDRNLEPLVIELSGMSPDPGVVVAAGEGIARFLPPGGVTPPKMTSDAQDLYDAAGLEHSFVSGSGPSGARMVLEYLVAKAQ